MAPFEKQTTPYSDRTKAGNTTLVGIWLTSTALFGYHLTDWHHRMDENYDRFAKVKQML